MAEDQEKPILSQYVKSVKSFSSEYGSHVSNTYTVSNIVGPPQNSEIYGDHVGSLVFRTYGPWWQRLPYHREYKPIGYQPKWFESTDFFEVEFDKPVFPTQIKLYETFSPGGLVRILMSDYETEIPAETQHLSRWKTIWRDEASKKPHKYNIFVPKIPKHSKRSIATKHLRFEFNDALCDYYHELDGVQLSGHPWKQGVKASAYFKERVYKNVKVSVPTEMFKNMKIEDKRPKIVVDPAKCYFDILPLEVIRMIIGYVEDFVDLAQVARVSPQFSNITMQDCMFREINLKPFYKTIKGDDVIRLTSVHSEYLTKLDLSWTGVNDLIQSKDVINALPNLCNLVELRCRNCSNFVCNDFLEKLANSCTNLKLLDLFHSYYEVASSGYVAVSTYEYLKLDLLKPLVKLEYLDVSQCWSSFIGPDNQSVTLFESLVNIKWFLAGDSYGSRSCMERPYDVCEKILNSMSFYCKEIRGLNLWRHKHMKSLLKFVERFGSTLQYLDMGWTASSAQTTERNFWKKFTELCPNLECLSLTALRVSLEEEDFKHFAQNCPKLRQLDLLGAHGATANSLRILLDGCEQMEFIDVSYAYGIVDTDVLLLKEQYPHCSIKHVPLMLSESRAILQSFESENVDPGTEMDMTVSSRFYLDVQS